MAQLTASTVISGGVANTFTTTLTGAVATSNVKLTSSASVPAVRASPLLIDGRGISISGAGTLTLNSPALFNTSGDFSYGGAAGFGGNSISVGTLTLPASIAITTDRYSSDTISSTITGDGTPRTRSGRGPSRCRGRARRSEREKSSKGSCSSKAMMPSEPLPAQTSTVASGAQLQVVGSGLNIPRAFSILASTGIQVDAATADDSGALLVTGGSDILSGAPTLAASTVNVTSGSTLTSSADGWRLAWTTGWPGNPRPGPDHRGQCDHQPHRQGRPGSAR